MNIQNKHTKNNVKKREVVVVGAGVAGLSAACYAAKKGHRVTLLDNHTTVGGRLRTRTEKGFVFDLGPSWYWMPDVFEQFFSDHNVDIHSVLTLKRLDPSYTIFWENEAWNIPSGKENVIAWVEGIESGAGEKLRKYLTDAERKYRISMQDFIEKPALSLWEYVSWKSLRFLFKGKIVGSLDRLLKKLFFSKKLRRLLEFPVLFLGTTAKTTPRMYTLMNYADMALQTWYPVGGMGEISKAMQQIVDQYQIQCLLQTAVTGIECSGNCVTHVETTTGSIPCDELIWAADYHFFDTQIAPKKFQSYSIKYWDSRTLSPSCLLFYVGVSQKVSGLNHHNLFFDADFDTHLTDIYETHNWTTDPLFYVCCPSKTDETVAPVGMENIFVLIPVSGNLKHDVVRIEEYYQKVLERMEKQGIKGIRGNERVREHFFVNDFKEQYNSFRGNAYGLANTLQQTAFLKPKMKSKKLRNVVFAGQMTNPGPGLPPSLISGKIAANLLGQ